MGKTFSEKHPQASSSKNRKLKKITTADKFDYKYGETVDALGVPVAAPSEAEAETAGREQHTPSPLEGRSRLVKVGDDHDDDAMVGDGEDAGVIEEEPSLSRKRWKKTMATLKGMFTIRGVVEEEERDDVEGMVNVSSRKMRYTDLDENEDDGDVDAEDGEKMESADHAAGLPAYAYDEDEDQRVGPDVSPICMTEWVMPGEGPHGIVNVLLASQSIQTVRRAIREMHHIAANEDQLKKELYEIRKELRSANLRFESNEWLRSLIIVGHDEYENLFNHLDSRLEYLSSTRSIVGIHDRFVAASSEIRSARTLVAEARMVQSNLIVLSRVLGLSQMRSKNMEVSSEVQECVAMWKSISGSARDQGKLYVVCGKGGAFLHVKRLSGRLEGLRRTLLTAIIATVRAELPRLLLVGEDNLLQVMSVGSAVDDLPSHVLCHCFGPVRRLLTSGIRGARLITGVEDNNGERVMFDESVALNPTGSTTTELNEISKELHRTLRAKTLRCYTAQRQAAMFARRGVFGRRGDKNKDNGNDQDHHAVGGYHEDEGLDTDTSSSHMAIDRRSSRENYASMRRAVLRARDARDITKVARNLSNASTDRIPMTTAPSVVSVASLTGEASWQKAVAHAQAVEGYQRAQEEELKDEERRQSKRSQRRSRFRSHDDGMEDGVVTAETSAATTTSTPETSSGSLATTSTAVTASSSDLHAHETYPGQVILVTEHIQWCDLISAALAPIAPDRPRDPLAVPDLIGAATEQLEAVAGVARSGAKQGQEAQTVALVADANAAIEADPYGEAARKKGVATTEERPPPIHARMRPRLAAVQSALLARSHLLAIYASLLVHYRDVLTEMHGEEVDSPFDVRWLQRMRYAMDGSDVVVRVADTQLPYGFAYQG